ncbi:MAG: N-acetyltransferase, partial [Flavobacteriaceae bacterium]|nr:N-acetyltransferase [Flavobacteriaceae bacterium]
LQDRKIFLTKLIVPTNINNDDFIDDFLKLVMENIQERNISVVPTSPPIAKFIRKNRRYKRMLPVGIRI